MSIFEPRLDIDPRRHKLHVVIGFRKAAIGKLDQWGWAADTNIVSDRLTCRPAVARGDRNRRFHLDTMTERLNGAKLWANPRPLPVHHRR